jgi:hypothetical protein
VVAAVGFKGRRLDIPSNINANVASIIQSCWAEYVILPNSIFIQKKYFLFLLAIFRILIMLF